VTECIYSILRDNSAIDMINNFLWKKIPQARDQLKRNYNLGQYWLEVDIEDVSSFDESLADKLYAVPTENLPLVR
jgi:hypothetical protein